ncbi:lipooligosaccharided-glycero-D-manno-heptosyltransferase [Aeromonas sp. HMWF015]|nr:lipooligosaccharided-glycero-D-manno-heptosyltransferase [Aeromonas sp. HMWF015]
MIEVIAVIKTLQLWRDILRRKLGILLFDRHPSVRSSSYGATVFVRWDAKLGDAIVSSWVAREIKNKFPERKVYVITSSAMAPLFRDFFNFDSVFEIPKRAGYIELKKLASELGDVDYLVHFSQKMKMKDLYFISNVGSKNVAGIDDDLDCINIKLGQETAGMHFATKFKVLLEHMGIVNPDTSYIVPFFQDFEDRVGSWWPSHKTLCFNPYGSGTSRCFSVEKIIELINTMLGSSNYNICLLYPPGREKDVERVVSHVYDPARVIIDHEKPSLAALFAQARHCAGMVSVDTATVHIATGLNKPVLGIYNDNFGMPENVEWHPNNPRSSIIYAETRSAQQDVNFINVAEFKSVFEKWVADYL